MGHSQTGRQAEGADGNLQCTSNSYSDGFKLQGTCRGDALDSALYEQRRKNFGDMLQLLIPAAAGAECICRYKGICSPLLQSTQMGTVWQGDKGYGSMSVLDQGYGVHRFGGVHRTFVGR